MPTFILADAQISCNKSILDVDNWARVSGSFVANGTEEYLTIGLFIPKDSVNRITVNTNTMQGAYYFIDDIALYPCNTPVDTARAGQDQKICRGDSIQLGGHNLPGYRYYWFVDTLLVSREARPVFSPEISTTYVLGLKDFKFDETWDTVVVEVVDCDALPKADAGNDTVICLGDEVTAGTHKIEEYIYHWYKTGDTNLISTEPALVFQPSKNVQFVLKVVDYMGQVSFDTINIDVVDCNAIIPNAGNDTSICAGDSLHLGNPAHEHILYSWYYQDFLLSTMAQIIISPVQSSIYELRITNPKNEVFNDFVEISVEECDIPLEIPNVITPNADGYNDEFIIINPMQAELDIKIFNRWGKLVFQGDENTPWDAKSDERSNPSGVYYYVVTASKHMRRNTEYNGVVHVVR